MQHFKNDACHATGQVAKQLATMVSPFSEGIFDLIFFNKTIGY
jgi:hypothetical protein